MSLMTSLPLSPVAAQVTLWEIAGRNAAPCSLGGSMTSRTLARIAVAAGAALFATVAAASPAHADGTVVTGNQNCVDLIPGSEELRVQSPADGTFSNPDGFSVTLDVRTLTADDPQHPGDQTDSPVFDFTATGGTVVGVAVKGG